MKTTAGTGNLTLDYETNTVLNNEANAIYDYIYGNLVAQICYLILITLSLLGGPLLSVPIVLYERFGADAQKRTIMNRLVSMSFSNLTIVHLLWGILRLVRHFYGLLPSIFTSTVFYFRNWLFVSTILCYNQMTIFRFLYIVIWRRMKVINDEFWITILGMSTYLIAFVSCVTMYLHCVRPTDLGAIVELTKYDGKDNKRYILSNT